MTFNTRTRLFIGFSSVDSGIKQTQWTDLDLIKRDLINHFYTRKGERVMRPDFGCIIWDLLFEPMTTDVVTQIVEDATQIVKADNRVELQDIRLLELDHGIQLQLDLFYAPLNIVDNFSVDFDRRNLESTNS